MSSASEPDSQSARHVLIVDDEPYLRELLARWLADDGFECTQAGDVLEAVCVLERQEFDLLLCDINMPGKSGIDLLVAALELYPCLAVLMITALDDRATAIRTLECGAFGYMIKPFDKNEMHINVANALERRRLLQASRRYQERLEEDVRERTADIRRREEEVVLRLVTASEWRDSDTGAHIRRIGAYCAVLASALGWDGAGVEDIGLAATMHDIGKIGVPDTILLKPGKLTTEEFEVMKGHTVIGADMLAESKIRILEIARDIALSHHERWNGNGYPKGLAGEAIPQVGRIVAITDVYDALVHKRIYKDAFPEEKVLAIMTEERGEHFDPEIFDCFTDVLPEFRRIRDEIRG